MQVEVNTVAQEELGLKTAAHLLDITSLLSSHAKSYASSSIQDLEQDDSYDQGPSDAASKSTAKASQMSSSQRSFDSTFSKLVYADLRFEQENYQRILGTQVGEEMDPYQEVSHMLSQSPFYEAVQHLMQEHQQTQTQDGRRQKGKSYAHQIRVLEILSNEYNLQI